MASTSQIDYKQLKNDQLEKLLSLRKINAGPRPNKAQMVDYLHKSDADGAYPLRTKQVNQVDVPTLRLFVTSIGGDTTRRRSELVSQYVSHLNKLEASQLSPGEGGNQTHIANDTTVKTPTTAGRQPASARSTVGSSNVETEDDAPHDEAQLNSATFETTPLVEIDGVDQNPTCEQGREKSVKNFASDEAQDPFASSPEEPILRTIPLTPQSLHSTSPAKARTGSQIDLANFQLLEETVAILRKDNEEFRRSNDAFRKDLSTHSHWNTRLKSQLEEAVKTTTSLRADCDGLQHSYARLQIDCEDLIDKLQSEQRSNDDLRRKMAERPKPGKENISSSPRVPDQPNANTAAAFTGGAWIGRVPVYSKNQILYSPRSSSGKLNPIIPEHQSDQNAGGIFNLGLGPTNIIAQQKQPVYHPNQSPRNQPKEQAHVDHHTHEFETKVERPSSGGEFQRVMKVADDEPPFSSSPRSSPREQKRDQPHTLRSTSTNRLGSNAFHYPSPHPSPRPLPFRQLREHAQTKPTSQTSHKPRPIPNYGLLLPQGIHTDLGHIIGWAIVDSTLHIILNTGTPSYPITTVLSETIFHRMHPPTLSPNLNLRPYLAQNLPELQLRNRSSCAGRARIPFGTRVAAMIPKDAKRVKWWSWFLVRWGNDDATEFEWVTGDDFEELCKKTPASGGGDNAIASVGGQMESLEAYFAERECVNYVVISHARKMGRFPDDGSVLDLRKWPWLGREAAGRGAADAGVGGKGNKAVEAMADVGVEIGPVLGLPEWLVRGGT